MKGWRTLVLNATLLVVTVAGALSGQIDDPAVLQWLLIISAVANGIMRWLTTGPVGGKV